MTGDHPIYDGPFGSEDVMPTFIELAGRRFEIHFEWKDTTRQHDGYFGWVASTVLDGKEIRGSMNTPFRTLFELVSKLMQSLQCNEETIVTDIPISISRLRWLMNSRSR